MRSAPRPIDESPPRARCRTIIVRRLARAKAEAARKLVRAEPELANSFVLAADTAVAVGRRILGKAELEHEAARSLRLLSGRAHRVHTAIALRHARRSRGTSGWSRRACASAIA